MQERSPIRDHRLDIRGQCEINIAEMMEAFALLGLRGDMNESV